MVRCDWIVPTGTGRGKGAQTEPGGTLGRRSGRLAPRSLACCQAQQSLVAIGVALHSLLKRGGELMRQPGRWFVLPLVVGLWLSSLACAATPWLSTDEGPAPTGSPPRVTPSGERLGAIELKYVLIDTFGPPFF